MLTKAFAALMDLSISISCSRLIFAATEVRPQIISGNHILIGAEPFSEPIIFLLQIRCAELPTDGLVLRQFFLNCCKLCHQRFDFCFQMGKKNADEMEFWTKDEFATFIEVIKDRPASYAIFMTMYYTGIREGELLALTPADIDFEKDTLIINKSYQRLGGKDIITTPKTPKSNRVVMLPEVLKTVLRNYVEKCYGLQPDDRLFPYNKSFLYREMQIGIEASGVKRIRVHDIRHSHASLLVELGFSPLLIAERLGHERVQTTMDTYSHLYPNKQVEVANQLDKLAI